MIAKSESGSSKEDGTVSEEARRIFGRNCRDARLKHGMSQQDLAEGTGITQGSPHYVLLNLKILLDVYSLGQTCILATVVRHHSLKSIGADASAEMQCDGSPLTLMSLRCHRKNEGIPELVSIRPAFLKSNWEN